MRYRMDEVWKFFIVTLGLVLAIGCICAAIVLGSRDSERTKQMRVAVCEKIDDPGLQLNCLRQGP